MAKNSKRKNEQRADFNEIAHADNTAFVGHTEPQFDDTANLTTSSGSLAAVDRIWTNQEPQLPRRKRVAGRSIPFSIKLRGDTLEYIYTIANERNVPLAQVIEELVEVHTHRQLATTKLADELSEFQSEDAKSAAPDNPASAMPQAKFTDAIHVRSRPKDRERFEDFAYRHRLSKGDAITRLLDFAEVEEKRQVAIRR